MSRSDGKIRVYDPSLVAELASPGKNAILGSVRSASADKQPALPDALSSLTLHGEPSGANGSVRSHSVPGSPISPANARARGSLASLSWRDADAGSGSGTARANIGTIGGAGAAGGITRAGRDKDPRELRRLQSLQERKEEQLRQMNEAQQKETERRLAEQRKKKEDAFASMYSSVLAGIDGRNPDLAKADATLERSQVMAEKKKEALYEEWHRDIFDKIQAQIDRQLEGVSVHEIERRRRELYAEFIHNTNTKAGLFRDIILEDDYDPLVARTYTVKYNSGALADPIKRDLQKTINEKRNVGISSPTSAVTRDVLSPSLWDHKGLMSTPYCHMHDDDGNPINLHAEDKNRQSKVVLDHYNVPKGNEAAAAEFPVGKKTFEARYSETYQPRGKKMLLDARADSPT